MSGAGDTSANTVAISYDAIVTPVSEAVTNTAIASVLFISLGMQSDLFAIAKGNAQAFPLPDSRRYST